jgi:hypothetical protein
VHKFRVRCDYINTVKSIRSEGIRLYGPIVKRSIREKQSSFIWSLFMNEGFRMDAHRLARSSINLSLSRHVWFLSPLDGVCNSVLS